MTGWTKILCFCSGSTNASKNTGLQVFSIIGYRYRQSRIHRDLIKKVAVWVLGNPIGLYSRFDHNAFLLKIGAMPDARFDHFAEEMRQAVETALAQLPADAREEQRRNARRTATATAYEELLEEIRRLDEPTPAGNEARNNLWLWAMLRIEQISDISSHALLAEPEIVAGRESSVMPAERQARLEARIRLNWQLREATRLDRGVIKQSALDMIRPAASEGAIIRLRAIGATLRLIDAFSASVQPRRRGGEREKTPANIRARARTAEGRAVTRERSSPRSRRRTGSRYSSDDTVHT